MTKTAEIMTKITSVKSIVDDARTQTAGAHDAADDLTQQAAAHGWEGVATSTQLAVDALDTAVRFFDTAGGSADEAIGVLGQITQQMSSADVAAHHATAIDRLEQVRVAVDAVSASIDEARGACEQAGSPGQLRDMLQAISDTIDELHGGLDAAKSMSQAEQQEATTWGN
jgi:hypothetical protein